VRHGEEPSVTSTGSAKGSAFDATVVTGHDDRPDEERAAAEREQAADTVARLTIKRDKAAQHLEDAERALADAEAQMKGGN
jgi:hypothetical protein